MATQAKLKLYTNYGCPFAQRVHITIRELGLPCEDVLIDLDTPREQWYLDVNPRGLVPTLLYTSPGSDKPVTLYESAIVAQFLADANPSHLSLPSNSPNGALGRAQISFFVDTFSTKVMPKLFATVFGETEDEREKKGQELIDAAKSELEPLLTDARPFFGGSTELTMAEVQTAPFVLRFYDFSDGIILPKSVAKGLAGLPRFHAWAQATMKKESVTTGWDKEHHGQRMRDRLWKHRPNWPKPEQNGE